VLLLALLVFLPVVLVGEEAQVVVEGAEVL
jgi:hypothetical protein